MRALRETLSTSRKSVNQVGALDITTGKETGTPPEFGLPVVFPVVSKCGHGLPGKPTAQTALEVDLPIR